jgi:hypothetical protein
MINERLRKKNEQAQPGLTKSTIYPLLVVQKIRLRYTQDEENAIFRKAIAGTGMNEFQEFNNYVE